MSDAGAAASTASELRVRLDASLRQTETLTLLMEREAAQMAAMERRAAVVVDDWSVLDAARAVLGGDSELKACSDDRIRLADAVAAYEAAVESGDWEALPHTKLLCTVPTVVFEFRPAAEPTTADQQPDTVARKLDTSGAADESAHVVITEPEKGDEPSVAITVEGEPEEESAAQLDAATKIAQVAQFREAAEASQEQLRVLAELREHEHTSAESLSRLLADVDPEHGRDQPHRRRRVPPLRSGASNGRVNASMDGTRTEGGSVSADVRRMHSVNEAHLPAVQRALRLIGPGPYAPATPAQNVSNRWREALRIAESLRSQCVARSAAIAARVTDAETDSAVEVDAALLNREAEAGGDVKPAKQLLEVTEELQFAIRAAAGMKAKRRHTVGGGLGLRAMSRSSRHSSVGPTDAILAHAADRAATAAAVTSSRGSAAGSEHGDEDAVDDSDDEASSGAIIEELQSENAGLKLRIAELEGEAQDAKEKAAAAEADAKAAREETATVVEERGDLRQKLAEVDHFLAQSREAIAELQEEQRLTDEAHREALADADAAHDATKAELAAAHGRLKNLQGIEDAVAKWRDTEKELTRVAESATESHYSMRKQLDETNVKLSALEVRAARDQLAAKEARARVVAVTDDYATLKKATREALDAHAVETARLQEAIEAAKMLHADELEQQRSAAAEAQAASAQEIAHLNDTLMDTQQQLDGAEARLAAIRKARQDRKFASPTSAYRSRQRAEGEGDEASLMNASMVSGRSTLGPASPRGIVSPRAGEFVHAASMPNFGAASRGRSSASPAGHRPNVDLSYFASSVRRGSEEPKVAARGASVGSSGGAGAGTSPEPRASSSTMLWDDSDAAGDAAPEPEARVPDVVLDHQRTAALLRQWEFEQRNRPRV